MRYGLGSELPERDAAVLGPHPRGHLHGPPLERGPPVSVERTAGVVLTVDEVSASEGHIRRLTITDPDGDRLTVSVWPDGEVMLTPGDASSVSIRPDDDAQLAAGLALLSFLADALGVERVVPGGGE